nr:helix-turn-helix transcriptional regulator [uncultured Roseovarius sp.]
MTTRDTNRLSRLKAETRPSLPAMNFSSNLKLLCSEQPSVAEVCRKIGINRQQFNKYLAGQSLPSNKNINRISAFFGVDRMDLELPHREFAALHQTTAQNRLLATSKFGMQFDLDTADVEELERYCGVYRTYSKVPYTHQEVLIGVCLVKRIGNRFISKYIERQAGAQALNQPIQTVKMFGAVCREGGFIHILDRYAVTGTNSSTGYSLTMLHPSRHTPIHLLVGVTLSLAGDIGGAPYSTKIVYEKLADDISVREIIRASGRYGGGDPTIPEDVRRLIDNKMANDQPVLSHQPV